MAKKKRTVFAETDGGKLYVEVAAVMHYMIPYIDGITVTFFGKSKKAYLDIDTAIDWLEKECRENPPFAAKDGLMKLEVCKLAKEKFLAGNTVDA